MGRQHKPWPIWNWGLVGASVPVALVLLVVALYGAIHGVSVMSPAAYGREGAATALVVFVLFGGWVILVVVAAIGMCVGVNIGRKRGRQERSNQG